MMTETPQQLPESTDMSGDGSQSVDMAQLPYGVAAQAYEPNGARTGATKEAILAKAEAARNASSSALESAEALSRVGTLNISDGLRSKVSTVIEKFAVKADGYAAVSNKKAEAKRSAIAASKIKHASGTNKVVGAEQSLEVEQLAKQDMAALTKEMGTEIAVGRTLRQQAMDTWNLLTGRREVDAATAEVSRAAAEAQKHINAARTYSKIANTLRSFAETFNLVLAEDAATIEAALRESAGEAVANAEIASSSSVDAANDVKTLLDDVSQAVVKSTGEAIRQAPSQDARNDRQNQGRLTLLQRLRGQR